MLMSPKEKRDGTIKASGCANGHKKQEKYDNAETTSPTVYTKGVLIYAVIYASKEWYVEFVEIPWTYMRANIHNNIFMIFRETM